MELHFAFCDHLVLGFGYVWTPLEYSIMGKNALRSTQKLSSGSSMLAGYFPANRLRVVPVLGVDRSYCIRFLHPWRGLLSGQST